MFVFRDYRYYTNTSLQEYVMAPSYQWGHLSYTATHVVSEVTFTFPGTATDATGTGYSSRVIITTTHLSAATTIITKF